MGYFNYFIRQFIRIFTKKFFWFILIFVFVIGIYHFVFANYTYDFTDGTFYYKTTDLPLPVYESMSSLTEFDANHSIFVFSSSYYGYRVIFAESGISYYCGSRSFHMEGTHSFSFYDISSSGVVTNSGTATLTNYYEQNSVLVYCDNLYLTTDYELNSNFIFQTSSDPYIANTSSTIVNWSFDYLVIELGDYSPYYTYIDYPVLKNFVLDIDVNNTTYHLNINDYLVDDTAFYIPRAVVSNYFVVRDGLDIDFDLFAYENNIEFDFFGLSNYTLSITSAEQEIINQDSEKYQLGSLIEGQQQISSGISDLNDTITDSSIDDISMSDLPSDNTTDITRDGINGIFSSIYNAFCVGEPQDIVFPVPFTNQNISLSPNYVSDNLNNIGASFIILLIQAFWWYLISRFIIMDISDKINKIKSGNIEKIENSNIKEGML